VTTSSHPHVVGRARPSTSAVAVLVPALCAIVVPTACSAAWPTNPFSNLPVCTVAAAQSEVAACPDGAGGVIVAWTDRRGSSADIYAQRVDASGVARWGPNGLPVCMAAFDQTRPSICSDRAGGAVIAWQDLRSAQDSDIYAQRVSAGGVPLWQAGGVPVCTVTNDQTECRVAPDSTHGAYVVWKDARSGTGASPYVQRITGPGVTGLPANGLGVSGEQLGTYPVLVAEDAAGGAIIAWNLRVQRLAAGGSFVWNPGGMIVMSRNIEALVPDSTGGAIVAAAGTSVVAQRIAAFGYPQWGGTGVVASDAGGLDRDVTLVCDSAASAVMLWSDDRTSPAGDIYGQRIGTGGLNRWGTDGRVVCAATASQDAPIVASDRAGGAVACWRDARNGQSDVYAQRLSHQGAPLWTTDGVAVTVASRDQDACSAVGDGAGGLLAAWVDGRSDVGDIYAQWVAPNGLPGGSTVAVAGSKRAALWLGQPYPNPTHGDVAWTIALPRSQVVRVDVYDGGGRRIRTVFEGESGPGAHELHWDARDGAGRSVAPGIYELAVECPMGRACRRIAVMR
jgi:flagellar hook capping protein FlgD